MNELGLIMQRKYSTYFRLMSAISHVMLRITSDSTYTQKHGHT